MSARQAIPARAARHARREQGFGSGALLISVLFLVAAAGLAWVYAGMMARDRWPIQWLEVDGAFQRVSAEQLRARVTPLVTGSFFTIDLEQVADAARGLPWVADVAVQKRWPDTVHVTVVEFQPVAHWTAGRLLSGDGRAFEVPRAETLQGLPWLEGPDGQRESVFERWQAFNGVLQGLGLECDRVRLDARGSWSLVLNNGTTVQLGREQPMSRLQRLVEAWPQLLASHQAIHPLAVDARYANGFAVRWPVAVEQVAQRES